MTASRPDAYDAALSVILSHAKDLGAWLGIWEDRTEPDAHARRCASDAVDAIDAMLRDPHHVRQQLISEIRDSDDATAARADALLARLREKGERGERGELDGCLHQAVEFLKVRVTRRGARFGSARAGYGCTSARAAPGSRPEPGR